MSIEQLIILYKQYRQWNGGVTFKGSFEGFMDYLDKQYWNDKAKANSKGTN